MQQYERRTPEDQSMFFCSTSSCSTSFLALSSKSFCHVGKFCPRISVWSVPSRGTSRRPANTHPQVRLTNSPASVWTGFKCSAGSGWNMFPQERLSSCGKVKEATLTCRVFNKQIVIVLIRHHRMLTQQQRVHLHPQPPQHTHTHSF